MDRMLELARFGAAARVPKPPHKETHMDIELRIRERAYEIWDAQGQPDGQDAEHWLLAREEVEHFYKKGDPRAGSVEKQTESLDPETGPA